jgi:hypothetical protein
MKRLIGAKLQHQKTSLKLKKLFVGPFHRNLIIIFDEYCLLETFKSGKQEDNAIQKVL